MKPVARRVGVLVLLVAVAVAGGVAGSAAAEVTGSETVAVTNVVDGDTIDVRYDNGSTDTVRLLGVDTPETYGSNRPSEYEGVPNDYFGSRCLRDEGEDASAFMTDQLEGETVTLKFDDEADRRGSYGRLLAYVYYGGEDYNYKLVHTGRARVYDSTFSKSGQYYDAETAAQDANRDLWRCRNARTVGGIDVETIEAGVGPDERLNDEYVVLENTGYRPRLLDGWTVTDGAGTNYTFDESVVLAPGETVTLYTGTGTDTRTERYWGQSGAVWTDNGTVYLYAGSGELATTRLYNESGVVTNP